MYMTHNLVHKCILSFRGYIFIKISNFKCLYFIFLKKVLDSVCPETCTIQKTISQFKKYMKYT